MRKRDVSACSETSVLSNSRFLSLPDLRHYGADYIISFLFIR